MADNRTLQAVFNGSRTTKTAALYQYDYGQVLTFGGLSLPGVYEVHFSNAEYTGETLTVLGDANGVSIPDELLLTGDTVFAWIFLHDTEDDGETEYKIEIPVRRRSQPTEVEPTPVEQDIITQAIAALNSAVEHYPQIVNGEWFVWDAESGVFVSTGVMAEGEQGQPGQDGQDGQDGYTPVKGVDYFDGKDGQDGADGQDGYTPIKGVDYFDGQDGAPGAEGASAYEVAVDNGFVGTEAEWLASLKGQDGQNGAPGQNGTNGADGATFTPSVSSAGVISWTNDGGKQNPSSVDLVAAVINALPSAVGVSF